MSTPAKLVNPILANNVFGILMTEIGYFEDKGKVSGRNRTWVLTAVMVSLGPVYCTRSGAAVKRTHCDVMHKCSGDDIVFLVHFQTPL